MKIKQNLATLFLIESFTQHLALNNRLSPPPFFLIFIKTGNCRSITKLFET